MRKIDRRIVIVTAFLFIVALAYGIMRFLIAQKEEPPARRTFDSKRFVRAMVVEYSTISAPVHEQGRMSSTAEIDVSAEASGKIEQGDIMLKEGATFRKGQILFSIYDDEASLALKAKKSQFQHSIAILIPDISLDFPEEEKSFRDFFNQIDIDKNLPPFPEVQDEKLNIFLASRNVLSEYYGIVKDELQLNRHVVRAPFNGTLTEVFLEVGAYTNTGGTVARAINTSELELEVPLLRADAQWVRVGDPVEIGTNGKDFPLKGKVIRKGQIVDINTQSQKVFVRLDNNQNRKVLAGEYLWASFPGIPVEGVMEVPRNTVFNSNEVFLVKENRLVKQAVNIVRENTNTLLFNGLHEGDTLVVQSLINVYEGTPVTTSLEPTKNPSPQPDAGVKSQNPQARR